jgi:hypothetical protein
MTMSYICITIDGPALDNNGRGYVSRRAARAAAGRRGLTAVETRELGKKLPHCNDAQGWDDLRMRRGCPGY